MIEFIRILDARIIPSYLVKQVRFVERNAFYAMMQDAYKYPLDYIYAMINPEREIKGYIWYQVNVMNKSIFVNTISICDEWKHTNKTEMIHDFLEEEVGKHGYKKIFFLTDKPSFYEKMGFVKTKEILLMKEFG